MPNFSAKARAFSTIGSAIATSSHREVPLVAWQMGELRPRPCTEHSNANRHRVVDFMVIACPLAATSHSCTFQNGPALVGLPLKFLSDAGTASIFDVLYSGSSTGLVGDSLLHLSQQVSALGLVEQFGPTHTAAS
jgi:hypothetical protein